MLPGLIRITSVSANILACSFAYCQRACLLSRAWMIWMKDACCTGAGVIYARIWPGCAHNAFAGERTESALPCEGQRDKEDVWHLRKSGMNWPSSFAWIAFAARRKLAPGIPRHRCRRLI